MWITRIAFCFVPFLISSTCQRSDDDIDDTIEVGLGEDAILQCWSTLRGPATWSFNHSAIPAPTSKSKSRKHQMDKKNNLLIRRVGTEDRGMYECKVTFGAEEVFRTIELKISQAPANLRLEVIGKIIEGQPLHVECRADGSRPMKFEWLKEQILSEKVRAKIPVVRQNSSLWVKEMNEEVEGRYFCRVSNNKGTVESSVDLKMMRLPMMKNFQQNKTILDGAPLVVDCEAVGDPMPIVVWIKQNSTTHAMSPQRYGSSKLVISKVETFHEGIYVCLAMNEAGNESRMLFINVECIPKLHCQPESSYGWPGVVRTFTCTSLGRPLPSIQWRRVGQTISDSSNIYQIDTRNRSARIISTLKIPISADQTWLYGVYSCLAQNKHGTASIELKLLRADLPSMPHNVTVISENGTSATIKVAVEECRPVISSWKVEYREKEADNVTELLFTVLKSVEEDELTISDLKHGTEYVIFVSAGNEMGFGQPAIILVTTNLSQHSQGSFQLQQSSEASSKLNFEILSGCFGAALAVVCSLLLVFCLKKKRPWRRGSRSVLSSGIRCYSWYNATSTAKLKNKPPLLKDEKENFQNGGTSKSRRLHASPELAQESLDDRETSLSLLRTTSRRKTSQKYQDATLSPERVSIRTGTSALEHDAADACSGIYEEIPKSDSTAVSEILDEYHIEPHHVDHTQGI